MGVEKSFPSLSIPCLPKAEVIGVGLVRYHTIAPERVRARSCDFGGLAFLLHVSLAVVITSSLEFLRGKPLKILALIPCP